MAPLLRLDPLKALKEAIEQNEEALLDLNRQQLDRGLDSAGKSLGKYRNFSYKDRFAPVDLKNTGEWRRKFTLAVDDRKSEIFSQDPKQKDLEKKYGKDINGIPRSMLPSAARLILPDLIGNAKKQIV